MALRSEWGGGVCNFTLVKKKKNNNELFKRLLYKRKKNNNNNKRFVRVSLCVCASLGLTEMHRSTPVSVIGWWVSMIHRITSTIGNSVSFTIATSEMRLDEESGI